MPVNKVLRKQTIPQAEKDDCSSLFVANKSKPRGNINFPSDSRTGNNVGIQVPITHIPVDLSLFCVREDILRSPDFRRLVAKGFLAIIEPEDAVKYLEEPASIKEYNRIYNVLNTDTSLENLAQSEKSSETKHTEPSTKDSKVQQFAKNIILRLKSERAPDLVVELDNKFDTMSKEDVVYIQENSSHPDIKTWCGEALALLEE